MTSSVTESDLSRVFSFCVAAISSIDRLREAILLIVLDGLAGVDFPCTDGCLGLLEFLLTGRIFRDRSILLTTGSTRNSRRIESWLSAGLSSSDESYNKFVREILDAKSSMACAGLSEALIARLMALDITMALLASSIPKLCRFIVSKI
jgi:hypothetical protein